MTWPQAKQVLAAIAAVELLIGGAFFWAGMTLILPFSGLEVLLLAAAFYHCLLHGARREVVVFEGPRVLVQKGRRGPQEQSEFPRAWLRVNLRRGPGWQPSRLTIGSHGRETELGTFLTDEERESLATKLRIALRAD